MTTQITNKIKTIRDKVDLLEQLHKTCQLSSLGIAEPILNESRYLARALADVLFFQDDPEKVADHVARAELAVHSAINDAVDALITFVKSWFSKISELHPTFEIATSTFGEEYILTLKAIEVVDGKVIYSRKNRSERYAIYKELTEETALLEKISSFALKIPQIAALAQLQDGSNKGLPKEGDHYIAQHLHSALIGEGNSKFHVYLQPKYHVQHGKKVCIGAEALLRLDIGGALISPGRFIQVAEETQLIESIGQFVFRKTMQILRDNSQIPCISVNVSVFELISPNYASNILEMIAKSDISPTRIELEITEGTAINDDASARHLIKLSKAGVRIAIDDFGTGETRFDYLAQIPVDVLKIDMSLVHKYDAAPTLYGKLLQAITAVGQACKLEVIAEGVESEEHVQNLVALGITDFQGFYFGKSVTIDDFLREHGNNF